MKFGRFLRCILASAGVLLLLSGSAEAMKTRYQRAVRRNMDTQSQISPGQHAAIASRELKLADAKRSKTIPVRVTFPIAEKPMPVIIFSHGAGGSRDAYTYLVKYWAEHGYVCIQPSHDDSILWNRERKKRVSFVQTMRQIPNDKQGWLDRVADVSFVIDELNDQIVKDIPELKNKLDVNRIGVSGHSYGAYTSQLIGGAHVPRKDLQPMVEAAADPRVKAIIAISPQGIRLAGNHLGFDDKNSFAVKLPAFFITGDRDGSAWNKPEQREEAYRYSAPGEKYFMSLNGANHMTFVGERQEPEQERKFGKLVFDAIVGNMMPKAYGDENSQLSIVEKSTTMFWDAFLKGNQSALKQLHEGWLNSLVGSAGTAEHK